VATKIDKQKRRDLMYRQGDLEEKHCKICPSQEPGTSANPEKTCGGCPIYSELRNIGNELNAISVKSRMSNLPLELTANGFKKMVESSWILEDIRKHYHLSPFEFNEFINNNRLRKSHKEAKYKNISIKEYTDWINSGKLETAFCVENGISRTTLLNFKEYYKIELTNGGESMGKFSVEKYKEYQKQGLKDKEIAKKFGISIQSIYKYKSENGLSKKHNTSDESPIVEIAPKQVEPNWNEVQKTVDDYFEKKANTKEERVLAAEVDDSEKLQMQYKIDKLERDVQLHKDTAEKATSELRIYLHDYQKLEVDFRNSEFKCKNLLAEIEDLKETVQLNHLLMRQQVKFLNRLDNTVAVGEADHTWR